MARACPLEPDRRGLRTEASRRAGGAFAGLAEAYVASVFQRVHGLSLPHIRKALIRVQDELGLRYALAIPSRYTDGAKIRFDQAASSAPPL
jgi:hypothetical protein